MKKSLYVIIAILLVGVGVGYFYIIRGELIDFSYTDKTKSLDWPSVAAAKVQGDCAEAPIASGEKERIIYTTELYNAVDADIIYDPVQTDFISPSKTLFTQGPLSKKINNKSNGSNICIIVWVQDKNDIGTVAYKGLNGKIQTIKVTNFPYP